MPSKSPHLVSEWGFEHWREGTWLESEAEGELAGGESQEEFVDRFSIAIWKANGQFYEVNVTATYLENLPYESYSRDREDYVRLVENCEVVETGG